MLLNYGVEKTLESPLNCKKIQPFDPKGNQSWMFIGRTDAKAETPILWPPDGKNWLIGKGPDAGKDWRWGQQRMKWLDGITDTMDWVWVGSRSWWWTGRPGVLWFMGSQRVGHDWATELNWWLLSWCKSGIEWLWQGPESPQSLKGPPNRLQKMFADYLPCHDNQ